MTASHYPTVAAAPNDTYAFVTAFFQELIRSGVGHVCISPGSRSTPLAAVAARQPGLRCWSHVDERAAAFFALGLARARREPVALVCTSGTAAANYLPALVEANHAGVSLIALTADRPPELRAWDAGQTIDQLKLFGDQVRWFVELPVPDADPAALRYARSLACRAVAEARGHSHRKPGPVHLNWPLREPLDPVVSPRSRIVDALAEDGRGAGAYTSVPHEPATPAASVIRGLDALTRASRGLIVCGPFDGDPAFPEAVLALARRTGWPVFADPASGVRRGRHLEDDAPVLANGDFLMGEASFAASHVPDVVLRFGSAPVSKALRLWIERFPPAELVVVDPHGAFSDASHLASRVVVCDPVHLCRSLKSAKARSSGWSAEWLEADRAAGQAVERRLLSDDRLLESRATRELCDALPDGALLYVSNSMPIRLLDAFLPLARRKTRVIVNRGANGIDGVPSSALGAAAADVGPTVLLTGDLALLHDLGGLLAGRRYGLRLVIVVLDNDGGGIFSFLSIAGHGEAVDFEMLFRTRHGLDFGTAAALFDMAYHRAEGVEHYRAALKEALACDGVSLIHVPVDRDESIEQFRSLVSCAQAALR